MKKLFTLAFALICSIGMYAESGLELYLVGDGTPIGWEGDGTMRQPCKMLETSTGVYQWTGPLKHGSEGFKICNSFGGWDGYHPSEASYAIADSGSDNYTTSGNDWKWNPTNTDWQYYTITLDTNNGTLSWATTTPAFLEAVDGVISIGTAEELRALALMTRCNVNKDSYNVKLTADIDYTAYKDGGVYSLGVSENFPFKGNFDGQNHTITVDFTSYSTRFSLFGTIQGTVHNLKVAGKITATTRNQLGGICGLLKGDGSKIYNCISAVQLVDNQEGDGTIAGISAVTYNAATIENCAFYGKISAPNRSGCGGIIGWSSNGAEATIKNCLVVADISWGSGENFGRNNPSVVNSYKTDASDATLANGKMTYQLNGLVSGGEDWFQSLGTDAMPTPLSTSGKVYANGSFCCDGVTPKEGVEVVMSNTDASIVDDHVFGDDAVCTGCHAVGQQPSEAFGYFTLTKAGHLLWWAQYVNAGHPDSKAVIIRDLDLSEAKYVPAGTVDNCFVGELTAAGHRSVTLSLPNSDLNYQGLIGVATDGALIQNITVKGIINAKNYAGGIVGGSFGGDASKKLSIINCGNEAYVWVAEANAAGIIGVNMTGAAHFYIKNCYNAGDVVSLRESGAITGWTGGDNTTIENTYNIGVIKNDNGETLCTDFVRGGGHLVNTYNLSASEAQVASGELCYKLGDAFSQLIGTDSYPIFDSEPVYAVGEAGYATLYDPENGYELNGDVKANVATAGESWLTLTEIENVPAGTPVVLEGTYYNKFVVDLPAINIANDLKGTEAATEADGSMYVLAQPEDDEVGFYKATGTIPAGKAYYQREGSGIKAFYFGHDDATSIVSPLGETEEGASIYNLAGQRIQKMQKGINIVGTKKILY